MAEVSKKKTWIWAAIIGVVVIGAGFGIGIPLYNYLNAPEPPAVVHIDVHEAKSMIDDNTTYPDLIVLDIREDWEFASGHLEDAWWIQWNRGSRSVPGSQFFIDLGFTKIYNMLGGIVAWESAGYNTTTA
ncbi:MAG: hypothetical protein ACTSRD_15520 [Promethearchaeota archaeon]